MARGLEACPECATVCQCEQFVLGVSLGYQLRQAPPGEQRRCRNLSQTWREDRSA